MIKTGILGADTQAAGELIRILINHPDVTITTAASDIIAPGTPITDIHPGLIGDTDLAITPRLLPEGHDAVFLCGEPWAARQWMETHAADPALTAMRIIDLTGAFRSGEHSMVYGLPEHNRKALVRGATRASIPSPAAMAAGLALFPLAKNMLLPADAAITVNVTLPAAPASDPCHGSGAPTQIPAEQSTRLDPIAPIENRPDPEAYAAEIQAALRSMQPTLNPSVAVSLTRDTRDTRTVTATISLPLTHPAAELAARYLEAYEDHNFTYLIASRPPHAADVANTNKCIIHLGVPSPAATWPDTPAPAPSPQTPLLRITSVIDTHLKGSAGNAVHILNLLFGLSERTGLALKASAL